MTVRVAIAGAGANGTGHALAVAKTDGAAVTAVYDVSADAAANLAERCGASVAHDLDELVADCDAVYVCSWTAAHRDAVERAVKAGRAVFCEKPLAPNLVDAEAITRAVQASGVVNQVGLPLRWSPAYALLRELLADPDNGRVLSATLHSEIPTRSSALASWRGDAAVAGGGMLLEVGFHDLDLLAWLLGGPTELAALTLPSETREGVEDAASVTMRMPGGALATLVAVWHDAPHRPQSRHLQVVCEHAHYVLEMSSPVARLMVSGPGDRQETLDLDELVRRAERLGLPTNPDAAFVRAVAEQTPAAPDCADALAVHVLIDAAYRSAPGGQWSLEGN